METKKEFPIVLRKFGVIGMLRYLLLLFVFMFSVEVRADSNAVAHVVVSAALTTALYYTLSSFTGREKKSKISEIGKPSV